MLSMMDTIQKDVKSVLKKVQKPDSTEKKPFSVSSSGSFKKLNEQVQEQAALITELQNQLQELQQRWSNE